MAKKKTHAPRPARSVKPLPVLATSKQPKPRRLSSFIVTGGCGFVGANLVAELVRREPGAHLVVIDDLRSGSYANIVEAFERRGMYPFVGDVFGRSIEDVDFEKIITDTKPTAVFHLGAITDTTVADEAAMLRVNTETFGPMVLGCLRAGVPLVYASSAATYGTPPHVAERKPFTLDAAGRPNNVYGFSKWLMESVHRRLGADYERSTQKRAQIVGLRYFNVFGPGESRKGRMASMVYQLAKLMLEGRAPRIFKDGSHARDQVYVDDVVDCTIAAAGLGARRDPVAGVYNVGSGVATSFNEIIVALRSALGLSHGELPTEYFEMPPAVRAFYQDYTCADISETERGLGWTPKHRPDAAISRYAELLRSGRCR
jgi:ADP-L-glycero-D-manno-heptose 6-epimerase